MDVGEEVVQPLADIDLRQLAASHEGVDDGRVLGCIVVAAEEVVLACVVALVPTGPSASRC